MFYNKRIFERCFDYKGKYWYKNIKYIPLYFKQIYQLVKRGYDPGATWGIDYWFIHIMKDILKEYNENRCGTPVIVDNFPYVSVPNDEQREIVNSNEKKWNDIVNHMIELLTLMDEENYNYENYGWQQIEEATEKAKVEFFELFSKYFHNLWD